MLPSKVFQISTSAFQRGTTGVLASEDTASILHAQLYQL